MFKAIAIDKESPWFVDGREAPSLEAHLKSMSVIVVDEDSGITNKS